MTTDILNRFQGVKSTGRECWQAICPAHKDINPSLTITKNCNKMLLHCHAGCSPEQVIAAVGLQMKDLFFDEPKQDRIISAVYDYHDENKKLLYQAVRYEPKDFRARRPDGNGGWIWNLQDTTRVLYRLPAIKEAIANEEIIFIVEGEKDVDNLATIGLCATTNTGGAGKWRPEYSDSLQWGRVVILPDNDGPGRNHAVQVAASLYGKAKSLKILSLPNLPPKGDVSDWLAAGGTRDELLKLVEAAPFYTGETVEPDSIERVVWKIEQLSPRRFFECEPKPFEYIIPGLLAKGLVGFLYGEGGSYKSLAGLWLVVQRAIGSINYSQKWLDRFDVLQGGKSVFLSGEDVEIDLHHRVLSIVNRIHDDRIEIPLDVITKAVSENCLICSREQWVADDGPFLIDENGHKTDKFDKIVALVKGFGADLIVLETLSRISCGDENDNAAAARVVGVLESLRDATGATILCIAHSGKVARQGKTDVHGQNSMRGASALMDNSRFGLWFRAMPAIDGTDVLEIYNAKTFRTKRVDKFTVKINYPGFTLCDDDEIEPDVFELVIEDIKNNPGTSLRKIKGRLKKGALPISQAIRDAKSEGILEVPGKGKGSQGYRYVGE